MTDPIQELDVVALLHDIEGEGLSAGQTGTVVFAHAGDQAFEVEFPLAPRKSVVTTVPRQQLLKLRGLPALARTSQV